MSIVLWKTKKLQLRNLHASQTLGWSWNWNTYTWLIDKKFTSVRVSVRFRCDRRPCLVFLTQTVYKSVLPWPVVRLPKPSVAQTVGCPNRRLPKPSVAQPSVSQTVVELYSENSIHAISVSFTSSPASARVLETDGSGNCRGSVLLFLQWIRNCPRGPFLQDPKFTGWWIVP
jgi:hypothetical protein